MDSTDISTSTPYVPVLCRHYLKGMCAFGDACRNIHDDTQKNEVPLCKYYLNGRCTYGVRCLNKHERFEKVDNHKHHHHHHNNNKRTFKSHQQQQDVNVVNEVVTQDNVFAALTSD